MRLIPRPGTERAAPPLLAVAIALLLPNLVPTPARSEAEAKPLARAEEPSPGLAADALVTTEGADRPFAELLQSGALTPGERFFRGPVLGSRVRVNQDRLAKQAGTPAPIPVKIGLHTQASGGIVRKNFPQWTRWYQEDGNVQIFRLFKGEQNIRSGSGEKGSPGRVEAYTPALTTGPNRWREWEGPTPSSSRSGPAFSN
jgi:hypothetical protein